MEDHLSSLKGCGGDKETNLLLRNFWASSERCSIGFINTGAKLPVYFTKTSLYSLVPLKPLFHTVKLGFTGVYINFLISAMFLLKKIDCGYSLETPRRGGSIEYPQFMFLSRNKKTTGIFHLKVFFFGGKIFNIFEWTYFRNDHSVLTFRSSAQVDLKNPHNASEERLQKEDQKSETKILWWSTCWQGGPEVPKVSSLNNLSETAGRSP